MQLLVELKRDSECFFCFVFKNSLFSHAKGFGFMCPGFSMIASVDYSEQLCENVLFKEESASVRFFSVIEVTTLY